MDFNGKTIELDADGCLVNYSDWSKELAVEIAKEEGIEMTDRHWIVIDFIQAHWANKNEVPTIRTIKNDSEVDTKELYKLFPKGPVKKASRISGLPKPKSCI